MFFDKKVGDFIKKESESFVFVGLKIPRDYINGGSNGYREQPIEWAAINFAWQKRYINAVDKQLITYEGSWEK